MFKSTFLPVKVKAAAETAVYSDRLVYPAGLLEQAYAYANNIDGHNNNVMTVDSHITFKSNPEIRWSLPNVVMAYESLKVARENNFSYFIIYNTRSAPCLYVSTAFNNNRILVDAYTMRSVIVTKQPIISKIVSMLNKRYNDLYLMDLFQMIAVMESGRSNYLEGIIVDRYESDPYLAVNPLLDVYSETNVWFAFDELAELKQIADGEVDETESYILQGAKVHHKQINSRKPMSMNYIKQVLKLRDRLMEKKTDYIAMCSEEEYEPFLYISTNFRYLVNNRTFECLTITNTLLQDWIRVYAQRAATPQYMLDQLWQVAKVGI